MTWGSMKSIAGFFGVILFSGCGTSGGGADAGMDGWDGGSDKEPVVATKLAFLVEPGNVGIYEFFSPPVRVALQDGEGNLADTATDLVSLEIGANPSEAELLGDISVEAVAGVATFPMLAIGEPGVGYTLKATATGLEPAESGAFEVAAVAAPGPFDLLTPADGTSADGTSLLFSWGRAEGVESYDLELSRTEAFGPDDLFSGVGATIEQSHQLDVSWFPTGQTYYWRVIARNIGGATVASNAPFQFSIP